MVPVIAPWSTWANAACAARQNRATITSLVNAFKNESFGNSFLMASIPLQILLAISAPDVLQFSRNNVVIRGLCDIVRNIEKCQFRKAPLEMLLALLFGRCQSKNFIMVNVVSIDEISTHLFVDCRDNVPYVTTQSRLRNHLDFEVESRTYLSRRSGKYTMPRVRKSSPSAAPVGVISKVLLILEALQGSSAGLG